MSKEQIEQEAKIAKHQKMLIGIEVEKRRLLRKEKINQFSEWIEFISGKTLGVSTVVVGGIEFMD